MGLIIFKIIVALFIWMFLPDLIFKSTKFKKNQKKFIKIMCMFVGIIILIFVILSLLKLIFNLNLL